MPLVMLLAAGLAAQTLDEARDLHAAGEYRAALDAYARVAASTETSDPAAAATALNNACVIHNGFGEFEEALAACQRAVALRRELDDPRRLARTLNNLALARQSLGDYETARALLLEALEINARREDALAQTLNLSNLGALATLAGNYAEALDFHRRASVLAAEHAGEAWSTEQLQVATINRGVVLEHLGAYREALDLYRGLLEGPEAEMDERRRAQLQLNRGVLYRNLGDPVRAVSDFEEVAALYRRLEDPDGQANAYLNLALALDLNLDRAREAETAYREALELAARHRDRPEEIRALFYLGRFLARRGRPGEAEDVFGRCLETAQKAGSSEGRWSALAGLGRIAALRGDYEEAARRFAGAIEEIEGAGTGLGEPGLRAGFFGDHRPVYAEAAQVLAELHRLDPAAGHAEAAFELAQRATARALLDRLGRGEWSAIPLPAAEVRGALDRPLFEFFAAERDLLRFELGPDVFEMTNLGAHGPIREAAREVYERLEAGEEPDETTLAGLSQTLLAGGMDASGSPRVHIAPGDALDRLPFELLTLPGGEGDALIDRFDVGYIQSGSTLVWLVERERRRHVAPRVGETVAFRGFADPRLPLAEGGAAVDLVAARFDLPPLPAAAKSLEPLARRLRGRHTLLSGPAASEAAFYRTAAEPARVVHLATHTVLDERPGRGGAILLASGEGADGLLEPREIAALDQRVDLTVLAACRSAVDAGGGGALATLSGAFLAAGSAAVVATLWDVGDEATAVFMGELYRELGRGRDPSAALAETKRRLRSDPRWNRASLWSGYVLIGEAPAVAAPRFPRWAVVAIAVALLVAVLWVWVRGRRARRSG